MISSSNIDLSTSTVDDDSNRLSLLHISAKARRILDLPIADLTSDDQQYSTNRRQRSITKQASYSPTMSSSSAEQQQQQQVVGNLKSSIRGSFPLLKQREEMIKRQDSRQQSSSTTPKSTPSIQSINTAFDDIFDLSSKGYKSGNVPAVVKLHKRLGDVGKTRSAGDFFKLKTDRLTGSKHRTFAQQNVLKLPSFESDIEAEERYRRIINDDNRFEGTGMIGGPSDGDIRGRKYHHDDESRVGINGGQKQRVTRDQLTNQQQVDNLDSWLRFNRNLEDAGY